jgi:hypothetical protein
MQPIDEPGQRRVVSIPSLTAWLSLCILAAAWGRSLDEHWQGIWASLGAYGLAASVGLGILEKARLTHQKKLRDSALKSRVECGLERLNEQGATLDSINAAIRRLRAHATRQARGPSTAGRARPGERSSPLGRLPMVIAPVVDHDESSCELADSIPGCLREISLHGVSFCHAKPFVARVAVLTFDLDERQRLSFVVDVLWTEASAECFVTGGTVLAVGVPPRDQERGELLIPAQCSVA